MGNMIRSVFMAVVIIFIVITLGFRSIRIGLMSMIPNLIPVLLTYGAMGWLGIKVELSTVVVFTISLGIAVDDSIHFLARFREEFRKHGDHERAIRECLQGCRQSHCLYDGYSGARAGGPLPVILASYDEICLFDRHDPDKRPARRSVRTALMYLDIQT